MSNGKLVIAATGANGAAGTRLYEWGAGLAQPAGLRSCGAETRLGTRSRSTSCSVGRRRVSPQGGRPRGGSRPQGRCGSDARRRAARSCVAGSRYARAASVARPCTPRPKPAATAVVAQQPPTILYQDPEELELDRCEVDHLTFAAHDTCREVDFETVELHAWCSPSGSARRSFASTRATSSRGRNGLVT